MRKKCQLLNIRVYKALSYGYCHWTKSRGESEWWKVRGYVSSPGHLNDMTTRWVVSSSPFYNWESWDMSDLQGISPQVTKPGLKPSNYDPRSCCLPLSRVAHESEALGERLAYLLYTFLMNRPLGLIKGKKINYFSQQLQIICISFVLMANKRAEEHGDSPEWL